VADVSGFRRWIAAGVVLMVATTGVVVLLRHRPATPPTSTPTPTASATGPVPERFPVSVAADRRHLVDRFGHPFLYVADTSWTMLAYLDLDDAKRLIDTRRAQGFTAIQTVLEPFGRLKRDRLRADPFVDADLARPDEAYWSVVDQIIRYADEQGMLLYVLPLWMSDYGDDRARPFPTVEQVRTYSAWIAKRYRDRPNLVWVLGGDDEAERRRDLKEAMAQVLRRADPDRLLTYHPRWDDWTYAAADWLDVISFQKNDIDAPYVYTQVRAAYALSPAKPVLDAEPPYDPQTAMQKGDVTTPLLNRTFGWWAILSGALGVTYGGPPGAWKIGREGPPDWAEDVERPQAQHTANIGRILARYRWDRLVPDWSDEVVVDGRGTYGDSDYAPAARTDDGSLVVAYAPTARTLRVEAGDLADGATARWFDPTTGAAHGPARALPPHGTVELPSPGANAAGDHDWVLVISA
jgi:hypothetical protein